MSNDSTPTNYEAMARRYRPTTYEQVVGQEHVAKTLQNAIAAGRVAHAYLFCGAHGCGKTTMARIFACSLVCEKGPNATPCGTCAICQDVMHGRDSDVLEIDGASNNGVEQVRSLREQAAYIPTRARYKIYIIDEVHMLSVAAFNALLKTLEEPPAHVKFILATTDPQKIPGTILSRCQRFDFRLVPSPKLMAFLKTLVARENAEITDDALAAIAAFSGGSVRDSLVLLDQLLSYCGGRVTREDVEQVRGVAGAEMVAGVFDAVVAKDLPTALRLIDEVASRGTNCGDFLDQLIEFGRDLMQLVATGRIEQVSAYGPALNTLKSLSNTLTLDQTLLMLEVFSEARTRVRSRALSNPLVALEMAVARLAGIDNLEPLRGVLERLDGYAHGAVPQFVGAPASGNSRPAEKSALSPAAPVTGNYQSVNPALSVAPTPTADDAHSTGNTVKNSVPQEDLPWRDTPQTSSETVRPAEKIIAPAASDNGEDDGTDNEEETDTGEIAEPIAAQPPVETAPAQDFSRPAEKNAALSKNIAAAVRMPVVDLNASARSIKIGDYSGLKTTISVDAVGNSDSRPAEENDEADEDGGQGNFVPGSATNPSLLDNEALWEKIFAEISARHAADRAFLNDVRIDHCEGDKLFLSLPGGGTFIFEQLEDATRKKRLAEAASTVLGRPVKVFLKIREAIIGNNLENVRERRREVEMLPQVQTVLRAFDGEIKDIILGDEQ